MTESLSMCFLRAHLDHMLARVIVCIHRKECAEDLPERRRGQVSNFDEVILSSNTHRVK